MRNEKPEGAASRQVSVPMERCGIFTDDLNNSFPLVLGKNNAPACAISNFVSILENHYFFRQKFIRLNLVTNRVEYYDSDGRLQLWQSAEDSVAQDFIELQFGIYSREKYRMALQCYLKEHSYNPITEKIEAMTWDGKDRVSRFCSTVLGTEDTPYFREVGRVLFAGAYNRAFHPGCKCDQMVVLVGKQGSGKSTLVRWLALEDRFFGIVDCFEGQQGSECCEGIWIGEVSELLATKRARDQEAVKNFLSRQTERYRRPYEPAVTETPRRLIFVGTTNNPSFLTDPTGNRRYLPVTVNLSGDELYRNEKAVKEYIAACYAECHAKKDTPFVRPMTHPQMAALFDRVRENYTEEDFRDGELKKYLSGLKPDEKGETLTCVRQLWRCGLNEQYDRPTRADSNYLTAFMDRQPDWERAGCVYVPTVGSTVLCWRKRKEEKLPDLEF